MEYKVDVNDSLTSSALAAALDAIGSNNATLNLLPGIWTIDDDLTIPVNIILKIPIGAIFLISTGKTLTINGEIDAGNYKIFDYAGTGSIVFKTGIQLKSGWFGSLSAAVHLIVRSL